MSHVRPLLRDELLPPGRPPRRHLISIADLHREDVERLLALARTFSRSLEREVKKLPTLRGFTVVNLFYESSTRTSASFELAAKRLSADVMTIRAAGSSVDKGESLKDTAITIGAYDPDVVVIRHPQIGAPESGRRRDRRPRGQRRGRQAPAPDTGAPRPLHDRRGVRCDRRSPRRDRRRRPALAGRTLRHPGAAPDGGQGHRRRPAAPDPARDRGDGLRGLLRHRLRFGPPTSSTSCACRRSACSKARTSCRACASTRRAGA